MTTTANKIRVTCRVALPVEPPERFQIMPWGKFESQNAETGEPIPTIADQETLNRIVASFNAQGIDGTIDYNHQSEDPEFEASGTPALILGYYKGFAAVPGDGIYVTNVTWTPPGAELVRNLQARYPSYVGTINGDSRVEEVSSIGLTPKPYIKGIKPVVNKRVAEKQETKNMLDNEKFTNVRYWLNLPTAATPEEIIVELEKFTAQLRDLLSMDKTATAEQVINAFKTRINGETELRKALCKSLGLAETAKDEDLVKTVNSKIAATQPNPSEFVPVTELTKANNRIATLETNELTRNTADFLGRGEKGGKIIASNRSMWERLYKAGAEQAEKDLASAPTIAPANGQLVSNSRGSTSSAGGNAEFEKLVAEKMTTNSKMSRNEAFAQVCRERPDLREQLVSTANATRG